MCVVLIQCAHGIHIGIFRLCACAYKQCTLQEQLVPGVQLVLGLQLVAWLVQPLQRLQMLMQIAVAVVAVETVHKPAVMAVAVSATSDGGFRNGSFRKS